MSTWSGFQIRCDTYDCRMDVSEPNEEEARAWAAQTGWVRTEDGRDFCSFCAKKRAERKKPSEIVPEGVEVMTPFEAADAAGFARMYEDDEGYAHFFCCGREVTYSSLLGSPYMAKCEKCGEAIGDITGPVFGNATVSFVDDAKIDTEDPRCWVVASDYRAAITKATEELS